MGTDRKNHTILVTGSTRGIGLAIATRLAQDGANIIVVGKTKEPHPQLEGTIDTACAQIEEAGGQALGVVCDIRNEEEVAAAVEAGVQRFGGIDVLINNASAISLSPTAATQMKRWDLMHAVNARGTFLCGQACLPYLAKGKNPHIVTLSPPLHLLPEYFAPHVAYSIAKFGMSLCTLGWAEEFRAQGIAVNSLWPRTVIATAAVQNLLGGDAVTRCSRTPQIVADAAYAILKRPASFTGNFVIDEEILSEDGVTDFSKYAMDPGQPLIGDLFLPPLK